MIDVGPLRDPASDPSETARQIDAACREVGFFYITGHGIDPVLHARLEVLARQFFALPQAQRAALSMAHAGRAWRGWFPPEGELTSGHPDGKEGIYFGAELPLTDPRVVAGTPLHGPNLFPTQIPELRTVVLAYLEAMTALGHVVLRGVAVGLGLDDDWFTHHLTTEPLTLFRIFRYPPLVDLASATWGVAEHTDYGLLTILRQDSTPGLQVHARQGWVDAPPLPDTFVCNLGDMLERMTAGRYRSTPHRVRNASDHDRLSFPFFFDPGWDAEVLPIPSVGETASQARVRWDGEDVFSFTGTYGEYLLDKVGKVFPELRSRVIDP